LTMVIPFPARKAAPMCEKLSPGLTRDEGTYTALHNKVKRHIAVRKML